MTSGLIFSGPHTTPWASKNEVVKATMQVEKAKIVPTSLELSMFIRQS